MDTNTAVAVEESASEQASPAHAAPPPNTGRKIAPAKATVSNDRLGVSNIAPDHLSVAWDNARATIEEAVRTAERNTDESGDPSLAALERYYDVTKAAMEAYQALKDAAAATEPTV